MVSLSQPPQITASIRRGPRCFIADPNCDANSSALDARLASTPRPLAIFAQLISGLCTSSIESALGPTAHSFHRSSPERPLLHRWRTEAGQAGREIKRTLAAYEAGRDGFWLARWLRARCRGHTSSIPHVSRCRANIGARRLIASTQNY